MELLKVNTENDMITKRGFTGSNLPSILSALCPSFILNRKRLTFTIRYRSKKNVEMSKQTSMCSLTWILMIQIFIFKLVLYFIIVNWKLYFALQKIDIGFEITINTLSRRSIRPNGYRRQCGTARIWASSIGTAPCWNGPTSTWEAAATITSIECTRNAGSHSKAQ